MFKLFGDLVDSSIKLSGRMVERSMDMASDAVESAGREIERIPDHVDTAIDTAEKCADKASKTLFGD